MKYFYVLNPGARVQECQSFAFAGDLARHLAPKFPGRIPVTDIIRWADSARHGTILRNGHGSELIVVIDTEAAHDCEQIVSAVDAVTIKFLHDRQFEHVEINLKRLVSEEVLSADTVQRLVDVIVPNTQACPGDVMDRVASIVADTLVNVPVNKVWVRRNKITEKMAMPGTEEDDEGNTVAGLFVKLYGTDKAIIYDATTTRFSVAAWQPWKQDLLHEYGD